MALLENLLSVSGHCWDEVIRKVLFRMVLSGLVVLLLVLNIIEIPAEVGGIRLDDANLRRDLQISFVGAHDVQLLRFLRP